MARKRTDPPLEHIAQHDHRLLKIIILVKNGDRGAEFLMRVVRACGGGWEGEEKSEKTEGGSEAKLPLLLTSPSLEKASFRGGGVLKDITVFPQK